MPYTQKILEKKLQKKKKGDIFKIFVRQRMGEDAQTQELTKESSTGIVFSKVGGAVEWIKKQTDHGKIYVIRDRDNEMVNSYSYKKHKSEWSVLNRDGYYGGYSIGKVQMPCKCIEGQPSHPTSKKPYLQS